jgi:hypothetical protein
MVNSIFDTSLDFISEYLTGWTILIFIIIIIYFVALRKYYINKEQFYDRIVDNIDSPDKPDKPDIKKTKNKTTKSNKTNKNKNTFEGFETNIPELNTMSTPMSTPMSAPMSAPMITPTTQQPVLDTFIDTTLFDNLQLNTDQVLKCKTFYNTIIVKYIVELIKLQNLIKSNKFLNSEKEFNIIITKGVDDIINFLNNTIKSMNILTRSSIKNDLINILSNTIDNLIAKTNHELMNYINELAKLNSTTIDYYTMAKTIDGSRKKIEDYIEIDKLLLKYGSPNTTKTDNKVDKVLDKSFILPIYEKNFDRINQLVQSDFNDNYTQLAEKYGTAYTDYLNHKKKEDLNVNPLEMLSSIETGVVNFLTTGSGSSNGNRSSNGTDNINLIEQYNSEYDNYNTQMNMNINNNKSNPIPLQNNKLVNETTLNKNNMYKDPGNLGNYLIDKNTQKQILEGFETSMQTSTPYSMSSTSNSKNSKNNNKLKESTDIVSKLFSGDFLNYIMEVMNEKLNGFYSMYDTKFNNGENSNGKNNGNGNDNSNFKLDENLIPAGFLLFILSMLFYFIDLTS